MIGKVLRAARKLRGRSPDELYVRGSQVVAALLERAHFGDANARFDDERSLRLADGATHDADRLLAAWRDGARAPHPVPHVDDTTLAALRRWCPPEEADVVRSAERVLDGTFDLLGYEGLAFGDPIDWHLDPVHGVRAPQAHWSRIDFLRLDEVGDHKITWELNRQQYFVTLGQAYTYTRDERYARAFAGHARAWLDANPPKAGINWASSLEVAYRAISWVWALWFFRASPSLDASLYVRLLTALDIHGRHLARHLSTYFSPNTHLTGEALGLYYIGTAFPELQNASAWRATGRRILLGQIPKQVRPDGVYFEQASQYHRYTVEIYLQLLLLGMRSGDADVSRDVPPALDRLFTHLRYITQPDGSIPLFGDDDGGRLVQLDGRPAHDVRALLATGAVVLDRPELLLDDWQRDPAAHLTMPLWLCGGAAVDALLARGARPMRSSPSRHFDHGGYAVMRDGWDARANFSLVDCGPHGVMNCGHAHADALSLVVSVNGAPLLVDSGTYSYPGAERNPFRGADAHNVVTVDGAGSSEPGDGPFVWKSIASSAARAWASTERFDFFAGTHDGFARLDAELAYERAVLFVKRSDSGAAYWVVRDRVRGAREHDVAVRWHAAPGLAATARGSRVELRDGDALRAALHVADGAPDATGAWRVASGWVSLAYGSREAAPVATWERRGRDADVVTFVLPAEDGAAPRVTAAAATGGRAWWVEGARGRDLVVIADDDAHVRVDGVALPAQDGWMVGRWPEGPSSAEWLVRTNQRH